MNDTTQNLNDATQITILRALNNFRSREILTEICVIGMVDMSHVDRATVVKMRQSMIEWALSDEELAQARLNGLRDAVVTYNKGLAHLFTAAPLATPPNTNQPATPPMPAPQQNPEAYKRWNLSRVDGLSVERAASIVEGASGENCWSNWHAIEHRTIISALYDAGATHCVALVEESVEVVLIEPVDAWLERQSPFLVRLKAQVESERVVPFVGAGLSILSGLPGWSPFLTGLTTRQPNIKLRDAVKTLMARGDFEDAASTIEAMWGKVGFNNAIAAAYGAPAGALSPKGAVTLLPKLFKRGVLLTTNFDSVLEKVYLDASNPLSAQVGLNPALLQFGNNHQTQPVLFKMHGLANGQHRVLTKSEYDIAYAEGGSHRDALKQLFHNRSLLFMGASLHQDRTIQVLAECAIQPNAAFEHFAIVEANPLEPDQYTRLVRAGIMPLLYPPGQHRFLDAVLAFLMGVPPEVWRGPFSEGSDAFFQAIQRYISRNVRSLASKVIASPTQLRLLFMEASPQGLPKLALTEEIRQISEELQVSSLSDRFVQPFDVAYNIAASQWHQKLLKVRPDILHFSGHGNERGELLVRGPHGDASPLPIDAVVESLARYSAHSLKLGGLRVVVLNACYSALVAERLSEYIDIAIGMCDKVDDDAAVCFVRNLYCFIASGISARSAFDLACQQMSLEGFSVSADIPTFYHHSNVDPFNYMLCQE